MITLTRPRVDLSLIDLRTLAERPLTTRMHIHRVFSLFTGGLRQTAVVGLFPQPLKQKSRSARWIGNTFLPILIQILTKVHKLSCTRGERWTNRTNWTKKKQNKTKQNEPEKWWSETILTSNLFCSCSSWSNEKGYSMSECGGRTAYKCAV